jgi:hypothetical protein
MQCRRITTAVLALALAAPAAAGAKPAPQPPAFAHAGAAEVKTIDAYNHAITGDTHGRLPRAIAPAPAPTGAASIGDADGWQVAALTEAGLLAAFAVGSVAIVRARRRAPRLGM